MEYLKGHDLNEYLMENSKAKGGIDLQMVQFIGGQLISALTYLHERLIVHLDIKPANIMMTWDQTGVKLIDFGVSQILEYQKHTRQIALAGTYRYMPPEQHDENVNLKSDIWAFGCVIYELCTGLRPFDGINEYAMCFKVS